MNLRDLEYVIAVADHKNFTRAAKAQNVSQPALSNQIKKLEQELGTQIFLRGNGGVRLSRFGAEILSQARQIIDIANSIKSSARSYEPTENPTLRIGMTPTLAAYLSGYFRALLAPGHPNLSVFIVEEYPIALAKMVENQSIDVALIARASFDSIYAGSEGSLHFLPLWFEPLYLGVREGHELADSKGIWAREVPVEQLIRFDISFGYHLEKDLPVPPLQMMEKLGIDVRTSRFETVCRHVSQTDACTIINAIAAEQFKRDGFGLTFVPFADEGNMRELGALMRRNYAHSNVATLLKDRVHDAPPLGTVSPKAENRTCDALPLSV